MPGCQGAMAQSIIAISTLPPMLNVETESDDSCKRNEYESKLKKLQNALRFA